jgi:putative Holliday junction resolvase
MILGIDPGERRVGVAAADRDTRIAHPVEVIDRRDTDPFARIAELVEHLEVDELVVGRPTSLSGKEGPAISVQQAFIEQLRKVIDLPIRVWDERLTTVLAEQGMLAAGASAQNRKQKRDAVAAQIMLQSYVDAGWH